MSRSSKAIESYKEILKEIEDAKSLIASLPRGYISTKVISGHTYSYLQWREGKRVLSTYVNDSLVKITKAKIAVRKSVEDLLKVLKCRN